MPTDSPCPLCRAAESGLHARAHGRPHFACRACGLIFVPPSHHPDRKTERRRYETHDNDPDDPRYRAFLNRAAEPLAERVEPPASGLDYGAGPGPTLSVMLEERGYRMEIYDPFFAPHTEVLDRRYDFITCTETAEHFHRPAEEFERFDEMLKPGGWLALMTQWADGKNFERWSYARDVTHVCFYRARTMDWIAGRFGWRLVAPRPDVALFERA